MTNVPVNKDVLVWARKERGLTTQQAADRLEVPESELEELEQGVRLPTVGELRNMAAKYEIGFSALLMPEPLPASTRLNVLDFRSHQSAGGRWNPELLAEMDDINVMVDALADLRDVEPDLFRSTIPVVAANVNAADIARSERKRTGLTTAAQRSWKSPADAFRRLRALVEAQGVFVYIVSASDTDDWRGLAVYDDRQIPVIVINGTEPEPAARAFSLLHEYAHILLRQSAISDQRSGNASEIFCNRFAADFLMPPDDFRTIAGGYQEYWTDTQLRKIGKVFHTSMSAVALQLEKLDLAPEGFYRKKWGEWRVRKPAKRSPGPIGYYKKVANRLGSKHISVVFDALDKGRLNQLDAYELLDVQAANFPGLRSELQERQSQNGGTP